MRALESSHVCIHALVIGELACGNLKAREQVFDLLHALPRLASASDEEALYFIEQHGLMGRGIGYVDVHLLASTLMHPPARLWTRDKRLVVIAHELKCGFSEQAH